MCSSCKMDPHWERVMYERQGATDPDFGEVEVNYAPKKKVKVPKYKPTTRPGCPENDYGPHVYVWTTEFEESDFFSDYFGFAKRKSRICCGCGKRNGSDYSDEYMKVKERKWNKKPDVEKGVPIPRYGLYRRYTRFRWWVWENEDADYMAARKEYIARRGWDRYLYGTLY